MKGIMKKISTLALPLELAVIAVSILSVLAKPGHALSLGSFLLFLGAIPVPTSAKEWMMEAACPIKKVESVDARYLYSFLYILTFAAVMAIEGRFFGADGSIAFALFIPVLMISIIYPVIIINIRENDRMRGFVVGLASGILCYSVISWSGDYLSMGMSGFPLLAASLAVYTASWLISRRIFIRRGEV